ncbi:MAG TPA: zinc metallopeptidase [Phaeodactylibacter sp.]|nr:zinc metallopeptidase [Phaeodactylibacter sp.]
MIYLGVLGFGTMVGGYISRTLKSKFSKYSHVGLQSGLSGKEVAEQMLDYYNIHDVQVVQGQGTLTDHYNPKTKTVTLSPDVFNGRHVSAAAVAAHECGHAVQHDTDYPMLQMRSSLVPLVNVASKALSVLMMVAFMMINTFPQLMLITIIAFAMTSLFALVTLPVEFNASSRALNWLDETGVAQGEEYDDAKDALKWAALTYVAAALSSLLMLAYLIFQYSSRRR